MNVSHVLTHSILVEDRNPTPSEYGDPTWGEQVPNYTTMRGRLEHTTKIVVDGTGTQRQADHVLVTEAAIPLGSRVYFPGEDTSGPGHRPISVKQADTFSGYVLYETYF